MKTLRYGKDKLNTFLLVFFVSSSLFLFWKWDILNKQEVFFLSFGIPIYGWVVYTQMNDLTKFHQMDIEKLNLEKNNEVGKARVLDKHHYTSGSPVATAPRILKTYEDKIIRRNAQYEGDYKRAIIPLVSFFLK